MSYQAEMSQVKTWLKAKDANTIAVAAMTTTESYKEVGVSKWEAVLEYEMGSLGLSDNKLSSLLLSMTCLFFSLS